MGEFFRGWRRKAGLVTLALAMLGQMVWSRSHVIADTLTLDEFQNCSIQTGGGHVVWSRRSIRYDGDPGFICGTMMMSGRSWDSEPYQAAAFKLAADFQYPVRYRLIGAEFSTARREDRFDESLAMIVTITFWKLSLLWFVLPLTLLSAWLILIKPRPAKAAKESKHG